MLLKKAKASRKWCFTYESGGLPIIKKSGGLPIIKKKRFNVSTYGMNMGYGTCGFLLPL
jgi:hypothetical protein